MFVVLYAVVLLVTYIIAVPVKGQGNENNEQERSRLSSSLPASNVRFHLNGDESRLPGFNNMDARSRQPYDNTNTRDNLDNMAKTIFPVDDDQAEGFLRVSNKPAAEQVRTTNPSRVPLPTFRPLIRNRPAAAEGLQIVIPPMPEYDPQSPRGVHDYFAGEEPRRRRRRVRPPNIDIARRPDAGQVREIQGTNRIFFPSPDQHSELDEPRRSIRSFGSAPIESEIKTDESSKDHSA